jgi:hypothetical protein
VHLVLLDCTFDVPIAGLLYLGYADIDESHCIPVHAGLTAILKEALSPGAIFVIGNQSAPGDSQPVADLGTGQSTVIALNSSILATFSDVLADLLKIHATYLQILSLVNNGSISAPPPLGKSIGGCHHEKRSVVDLPAQPSVYPS